MSKDSCLYWIRITHQRVLSKMNVMVVLNPIKKFLWVKLTLSCWNEDKWSSQAKRVIVQKELFLRTDNSSLHVSLQIPLTILEILPISFLDLTSVTSLASWDQTMDLSDLSSRWISNLHIQKKIKHLALVFLIHIYFMVGLK